MIWGLAVAGEGGVAKVLALLRNELEIVLALCGCESPQSVGPELIGRHAPGIDSVPEFETGLAREV